MSDTVRGTQTLLKDIVLPEGIWVENDVTEPRQSPLQTGELLTEVRRPNRVCIAQFLRRARGDYLSRLDHVAAVRDVEC